MSLTPERILRLRPTDSRYRAIMAFMRWQMQADLWTTEPLTSSDVEDHHIFPAALSKRYGIDRGLLDSVWNRLLVSFDTNRMFGDRPPQEYLIKLLDESKKASISSRQQEQLQRACIHLPADRNEAMAALDVKNAGLFITDRATRIYSALERVLGDALDRSEPEDEE